jgi:HSP20 family protein
MTKKKEIEVAEKKEIEMTQGEPTREGLTFEPVVDIIEDKNAITLFADLPGVKRDTLDIDVKEGVLTISAPVPATPDNWQSLYQEYRPGGFTRRFSLSEVINTDAINAKLENGVLTLVLPKMEQHKPRRIEIR